MKTPGGRVAYQIARLDLRTGIEEVLRTVDSRREADELVFQLGASGQSRGTLVFWTGPLHLSDRTV